MKTVTGVYIHSSEKSCFVQKGRMVPICLHCLNCTKFGQLILRKTIKIRPDFKAKMHQIRFQLGLRPRPRWGSLQSSPDLLAGLKGDLLLNEGEGGGKGRGFPPSGQLWIRPWLCLHAKKSSLGRCWANVLPTTLKNAMPS